MKTAVSVVVPCYKSSDSLPLLADRLSRVFAQQNWEYELILVEDGSGDGTWNAIVELAGRDPSTRGYRMLRNYGQHNALLCGIRNARFPLIVTLDDDLQNPPEELPGLVHKLEEGYDVVYGTPVLQTHGFLRDAASSMTKLALQGVMGAETARKVSAFRAFRTQLRDAFANYNSPLVSIDVLLTWGGYRFTSVQVRNDPRTIGVSNYNFGKLLVHAMNMMTGFSSAPRGQPGGIRADWLRASGLGMGCGTGALDWQQRTGLPFFGLHHRSV